VSRHQSESLIEEDTDVLALSLTGSYMKQGNDLSFLIDCLILAELRRSETVTDFMASYLRHNSRSSMVRVSPEISSKLHHKCSKTGTSASLLFFPFPSSDAFLRISYAGAGSPQSSPLSPLITSAKNLSPPPSFPNFSNPVLSIKGSSISVNSSLDCTT